MSGSLARRVVATIALGTCAVGLVACGGGDAQGRQEPELREVESQVSRLRLEVQNLRRELATLRAQVGAVTTTPPRVSTTTTIATSRTG